MRRLALSLALLCAGCGAAVVPPPPEAKPAPSSAAPAPQAADPRAPVVHLRWVETRLRPLIEGQPRRKLALQLSGAARRLEYVGTFNGEAFDLAGTFVSAERAVLKASISWQGSGDEVWVERTAEGLAVHHRNVDEQRPYLTVNTVLVKVPLEGNVRVTAD